MPCFHDNQYWRFFYQTSKYRILSLTLYRLCNLYFHVSFGHQLHAITVDVQWKKIKKFIHDAELKFYFWCVSFFTIFIAIWLHQTSSMEIEEAFRKSLFQVISLQTSTGFATADYMLWPSILWGCLLIVMIIGACAGSTTGGIKCIRMVILFQVVKNTNSNIFFTLTPCSRCELTNRLFLLPSSLQYWPLLFLYAVIAIISILIMMGLGVGFLESIGTVISSIGNMGPGLGTCGPAFHGVHCLMLPNGCFLS